MTPHQGDS
jgi:hypothetical protein